MSLLMDAPPGVGAIGVLEALEALSFESMSVGEAGAAVRAVAAVHGRADVVHAKALAAGVLDALPALGEALAAGEVSAAHVDEIAAIVPAKLLPKAAKLVAAAKKSTPEDWRTKRISSCWTTTAMVAQRGRSN